MRIQIDSSCIIFKFKIDKNIRQYFQRPIIPNPKSEVRNKLNELQKRAVLALKKELLIERKNWRTIKSYRSHLIGLLLNYPKHRPSKITGEEAKKYIIKQIREKRISESTQNQLINALKALYEKVCIQKDKVKWLISPKKKPMQLPNILSQEEVVKLLTCLTNIKHKAMLSMIYSAG